MWGSAGSKVVNLKRISVGGLNIEGISIGEHRKMQQQEIYEKLGIVNEGDSIIKK
jgi:16S rRNA U516 pseudouridylate synthase RsuA-like enzyme